jgi:hypothetical protein
MLLERVSRVRPKFFSAQSQRTSRKFTIANFFVVILIGTYSRLEFNTDDRLSGDRPTYSERVRERWIEKR